MVYSLLISEERVFSNGDTDFCTFTVAKHHIDTGDSKPLNQRMRPLGYVNDEQERLEKILLKAGVIEPCWSQWASPSVPVRKGDGSVRWCIDLRMLNDATMIDRLDRLNS